MSNIQQAAASPQPVAAPRRGRKGSPVRYPASLNYTVTRAMARMIERLCPPSGPFTQSQLGRAALHEWGLAHDQAYLQEVANGGVSPQA
jgi:hypothetical protein